MAKVQVRVETERKLPAWYAEMFRVLFPDEWREFAKGIARTTLAEVFAETDVELVRITSKAPPPQRFFELFEQRYFPLGDCWYDWLDMWESEGDEFAWHEIPIYTFFFDSGSDIDAHYVQPVFQVVGTLSGEFDYHADCKTGDCPLRPVYLIAACEINKVNRRKLAGLCRRETGPLRHLSFALDVFNKDTGNIWFDMDYEMYGGTGCDWNAETVRALKREYDAADKQADDVMELNWWLQEDPRRIRDASALWRRAAA